MLKIRLSRVGRKNQPHFRLIVSEHSFDTFGKYLEILGSFDPRRKKETLKLKQERIKYWLSKGAKASASVHNILVSAKIITGAKMKATTIKKNKKDVKKEQKVKQEKKAEIAQKEYKKEVKQESAENSEGKSEKPEPEKKEEKSL